MYRQVIQNDPDSPMITTSHRFKEHKKLRSSFAFSEVSKHLTAGNIICSNELPYTMLSVINGSKSHGISLSAPGSPGIGPQFKGTELINTDDSLPVLLPGFIERLHRVFFSSNCGSLDSFHVFVLCRDIRFFFRIKRTVSSDTSGISFRLTATSRNFLIDQCVKGCPVRFGGVSARSTSSLSCSGRTFGGRPPFLYCDLSDSIPFLLNAWITFLTYHGVKWRRTAISPDVSPCSELRIISALRRSTGSLLLLIIRWSFFPSAFVKERTYITLWLTWLHLDVKL